jgi:hypothetical protein
LATQNEHGRLIAAAAKATLAPIGCIRRGQSRSWLSDQRYWAIMIEFQPSGFSKGSYLNVGASWLWQDKSNGGLAFNVGYRVEGSGFIDFEDAEQFGPLVAKMARQAAEAVQALRAAFPSVASISQYLNARQNPRSSQMFHAGVAAGLNGEPSNARRLFTQIQTCPVTEDWEAKLHAQAAALNAVLDDPVSFRSLVRRAIDTRRAQARLPPIADCLAELGAPPPAPGQC